MPSLNGSIFKKAGTFSETLHPTFHAASRATRVARVSWEG